MTQGNARKGNKKKTEQWKTERTKEKTKRAFTQKTLPQKEPGRKGKACTQVPQHVEHEPCCHQVRKEREFPPRAVRDFPAKQQQRDLKSFKAHKQTSEKKRERRNKVQSSCPARRRPWLLHRQEKRTPQPTYAAAPRRCRWVTPSLDLFPLLFTMCLTCVILSQALCTPTTNDHKSARAGRQRHENWTARASYPYTPARTPPRARPRRMYRAARARTN